MKRSLYASKECVKCEQSKKDRKCQNVDVSTCFNFDLNANNNYVRNLPICLKSGQCALVSEEFLN